MENDLNDHIMAGKRWLESPQVVKTILIGKICEVATFTPVLLYLAYFGNYTTKKTSFLHQKNSEIPGVWGRLI